VWKHVQVLCIVADSTAQNCFFYCVLRWLIASKNKREREREREKKVTVLFCCYQPQQSWWWSWWYHFLFCFCLLPICKAMDDDMMARETEGRGGNHLKKGYDDTMTSQSTSSFYPQTKYHHLISSYPMFFKSFFLSSLNLFFFFFFGWTFFALLEKIYLKPN